MTEKKKILEALDDDYFVQRRVLDEHFFTLADQRRDLQRYFEESSERFYDFIRRLEVNDDDMMISHAYERDS